jgi:hypothetical protein
VSLFSGWPWWAQLVGLIVVVLIVVFLFREIVLPLLRLIA